MVYSIMYPILTQVYLQSKFPVLYSRNKRRNYFIIILNFKHILNSYKRRIPVEFKVKSKCIHNFEEINTTLCPKIQKIFDPCGSKWIKITFCNSYVSFSNNRLDIVFSS